MGVKGYVYKHKTDIEETKWLAISTTIIAKFECVLHVQHHEEITCWRKWGLMTGRALP